MQTLPISRYFPQNVGLSVRETFNAACAESIMCCADPINLVYNPRAYRLESIEVAL